MVIAPLWSKVILTAPVNRYLDQWTEPFLWARIAIVIMTWSAGKVWLPTLASDREVHFKYLSEDWFHRDSISLSPVNRLSETISFSWSVTILLRNDKWESSGLALEIPCWHHCPSVQEHWAEGIAFAVRSQGIKGKSIRRQRGDRPKKTVVYYKSWTLWGIW